MDNNQFLTQLVKYWQPSIISFKVEENGNIGLYRDTDNLPLWVGESIDAIITKVRLYFSEQFIEEGIKKQL